MPRPTASPDDAPIEPRPLGEGGGSTPTPPSSEGAERWAGVLAALALLAGGAVAVRSLVRRRRGAGLRVVEEPVPVMAAPVPPRSRARVTIDFRPTRAGLNLLSATVEGEVTLANAGDVPATAVRFEARLLSAHGGQDGEIRALRDGPAGRPVTAPFDLAPGEERPLPVVLAASREAIRSLDAGGRPMFVPLVDVDVRFEDGAARQAAQAFAIGVQRVDSAKLAPLWLDALPRMFTEVVALPQGEPLER